MQLNFLKGDACPVCGDTTVVAEWLDTDSVFRSRVMQHSNSGRWEHRKFACGQALEYIPNYSDTRPSEQYRCQRDPELLARRERMQRIKVMMEEMLAGVPRLVDTDRQRVLEAIRSIRMP